MHNLCKNKKKIPLGTSRGLKWENKTYKLKRSIERLSCESKPQNEFGYGILISLLYQTDISFFFRRIDQGKFNHRKKIHELPSRTFALR